MYSCAANEFQVHTCKDILVQKSNQGGGKNQVTKPLGLQVVNEALLKTQAAVTGITPKTKLQT